VTWRTAEHPEPPANWNRYARPALNVVGAMLHVTLPATTGIEAAATELATLRCGLRLGIVAPASSNSRTPSQRVVATMQPVGKPKSPIVTRFTVFVTGIRPIYATVMLD
jgi:hypothetical protein